jgi:transketolase
VREDGAPVPDGVEALAARIRRLVLDESMRAHVGHIGSSLSIADILAALYGSVLAIDAHDDPDRDRFILSKGHAALALYAALALTGRIERDAVGGYCVDGTAFAAHPEHGIPGVEFSTGSLGHGFPMAAGAALAARLQRSSRRIFVVVSDAECNEGSIWEAAMFAAHHQLSNLVAIIDLNGQQGFGYTDDVLSPSPLIDRWRAFGWDVREIDGHDASGIVEAIERLDTAAGPPHALVARTILGRGVSFMERQIKWHYSPLSNDEYRQAIAEVEGDDG